MIWAKIALSLFLLAWLGLGLVLVVKAQSFFGLRRDEPWESPGARSLSVAHIASVWFGFFALGVYFLLR